MLLNPHNRKEQGLSRAFPSHAKLSTRFLLKQPKLYLLENVRIKLY